jgi:hypothetical protein
MSQLSLPRPGPDESAAFYHGYISQVTSEAIGGLLVRQLDELERMVTPLDDAAARYRYAPGKWSVKEVLGHLADAERIFAYRMLRIGRGDTTALPGFDENAYVPAGRFDDRPLAAIVAELRAIRQATLALAEGMPPDAWTRVGEASGKRVSVRALLYIIAGHVTHHSRVLRERYRLATVLRICDNGNERIVPASAELVEQVFAPEAAIADGTEITVADGDRWLAAVAVGSQGSAAEFLLSGADGERPTASGQAGRGDTLRRFRDFLKR